MTLCTPTRYPILLSPLRAGAHMLGNRVLMGAMHMQLELLDRHTERLALFYAARAREGVSLMVTGGFAPHPDGRMDESAPVLASPIDAEKLKPITAAVHREGGKILLQILHAGRYARIARPVGASERPSRINKRPLHALDTREVWGTIERFVRCAELARAAGFDGVEIMGSEGYLLNQFTSERTNPRSDVFGGSMENRHRLPVEIVRRTRAALGPDFLVMYRISAVDLVEDGASRTETVQLAQAVESVGADILNTGIGWHESLIPTIMYAVPRGAWRFAVAAIKGAVGIPVVASNRINTPEVAEQILAEGVADMISMARPLLADPAFVSKAAAGRADEINTCIACNQACLDYIFKGKPATCLVNPRAGRELDYAEWHASRRRQRIAIVGGGGAGMSCAVTAAERGHDVTLYEASKRLGGQLNYAKAVPGKQEFRELLRYFARRFDVLGVDLRLQASPTDEELAAQDYDQIVVATGVRPRIPDFPGVSHPKVITYADLLDGKAQAGRRVAVIGSGGIGFDVAEFLLGQQLPAEGDQAIRQFQAYWGVDPSLRAKGGLAAPASAAPARQVIMLQRRLEKPGRTLGLTTGWVLKGNLQRAGVEFAAGCTYERMDDAGLHVRVEGNLRCLEVDTVVICAGQEPVNDLYHALIARGFPAHLIGGAHTAAEIDALRAISSGMRLAMSF